MLYVEGRPMIGRRGGWLSASIVLLVSISLAMVTWHERLKSTFEDYHRFLSERPELHPVLVMVAPVLFYLLLVVLARWELDAGGGSGAGRELDWLLQCKRTGLLRLRANPIRGRSAPQSHDVVTAAKASHLFQHPGSAPTVGLDRLVQKKRSGAWSLLPTEFSLDPLAEHDQGEA
jgi:hypothetical protein